MNLLHLDSSILGQNSASRELSAALVARLRAQTPGLQVTYRDLAAATPKHLDGGSLAKADAGEAALGEELLQEFLGADLIVVGVPMYNFNIPSQLKAWIDRVAVAGRSFRYTAQGPEGLAKAQRVIVAGAYGGAHPAGGPSNFIEPYLRFMFGFLGIGDVQFVTAEGLAISPEQRAQALAAAHARIDAGELDVGLPLAA
ncbi:MAG TPA: NAD(P)H-dependent oxidoreductase [Xanthomonadaceae bacterium]|jgi:FMN-dependent NADH-azoreductase|nr:NAD(P)H-dependent oxidoreductase [Xanthomonadaceae bacterium]